MQYGVYIFQNIPPPRRHLMEEYKQGNKVKEKEKIKEIKVQR